VRPGTEAAMIRALAVQQPEREGAPLSGIPPLAYYPNSNWPAIPVEKRILYVMNLLVNQYKFPVNGASGIVGNLLEESGLIPNRIQGSQPATPMTSQNFRGIKTTFSSIEVMNRNESKRIGPRPAGIGIAQWTLVKRRNGLFQHQYRGQKIGADILFDMNAQVDYLFNELRTRDYIRVYKILTAPGVTLNNASDEVAYNYERPGSVFTLDKPKLLLPPSDPQVQDVFRSRRRSSQQAQSVYNAAANLY
jgi:hypothetical protein